MLDFFNERYINIKYQIEGTKKKYFFDIGKIEDRMEKLETIKEEVQNEILQNPKLKKTLNQELQITDAFPDKFNKLISSINKNLETTFTRLEIVEEKIKENQDFLRRRDFEKKRIVEQEEKRQEAFEQAKVANDSQENTQQERIDGDDFDDDMMDDVGDDVE